VDDALGSCCGVVARPRIREVRVGGKRHTFVEQSSWPSQASCSKVSPFSGQRKACSIAWCNESSVAIIVRKDLCSYYLRLPVAWNSLSNDEHGQAAMLRLLRSRRITGSQAERSFSLFFVGVVRHHACRKRPISEHQVCLRHSSGKHARSPSREMQAAKMPDKRMSNQQQPYGGAFAGREVASL